MELSKINLTFWQRGSKEKADAAAFATFLDGWWTTIKTWLEFPFTVYNVDTAPLFIVDLLAWQRDVERFTGEPETLYRLRVKHAFENATDAGNTAGFKRIWARLGLGSVEIGERIDGQDWDVVELTMPPQIIADNPELLRLLVNSYGRTCRRYRIATNSAETAVAVAHSIQTDTSHLAASTDAFGQIITFNGEPLTINGQLLEIN